MARALAIFTARYGACRVRVRVLPSIRDVDAEYREGRRPRRDGKRVPAFFSPARSSAALHVGTIVLAADGRLAELVPHEAAHASVHHQGAVSRDDDEIHATTVGLLTARIFAGLRRLGMEV